jgi:hypothetical protein
VVKKPKLTVVSSKATADGIPATLREHGRTLWKAVMDEYQIDDIGGLSILRQICSAADRAEELAAQIAAEGQTIKTKSGLRDHPALKHELAARSFIVRSLLRLGLNVEAIKPVGRPPGGSSNWR